MLHPHQVLQFISNKKIEYIIYKDLKVIFQNILKNIAPDTLKNKSVISQNFSELNYYPLDQFKQRLYIEKRRAERLNTKSSMIILNLKNNQHNFNVTSGLENIVKNICSNVRESDGVSLYNEKKILVLLPDTNSTDAKFVSTNLIHQFKKTSGNSNSKKLSSQSNVDVEIISFPEKQSKDYLSTDNRINKENVNQAGTMFKLNSSNNFNFKKDSYKNLNVSIHSTNGSSLAIPMIDTLLFDDEMFSNFSIFISKFIKRIADFVLSLSLLFLISPVLVITGLLIKLTSPGPILFSQTRTGYKGKQFKFLKFRSMKQGSNTNVHKDYMEKLIQGKHEEINNGSKNDPKFKIKDDSRITTIGKLIRKTSIDELPQLWNVLKGDMSLVGPRPPIPYEVEVYQNWHYRRIFEVKPGVTGLWQVSGRNKTTFNEMVRLDINYLENWSLLLDVKILFKTVRAVFNAEGN